MSTSSARWESTDKTWDEGTHEIGRELAPGDDVTVDWFVTFPRPMPDEDVLMKGTIVVYDAETDERLTAFPVTFVRGKSAAEAAGD